MKREAGRFNVVACGRRWGKTTLGIDVLIEPALMGYPVGWFSPTYKMLSEVWREVREVLQPVTKAKSEQEHRIELITGGSIDMWSLDNPDAARGRKYKRVVVDEAAMIAGLREAWNAVVRPTLTDFAGDAWFLSTPKGWNYFHELHRRGHDGAYPDWRCWQMPTTANPHIDPREVEMARLELPEQTFSQEYLAEFLSNDGGVFRNLEATCVIREPDSPEQHDGHNFVAGVDWGRSNDATVITVICRDCKRVVDWKRLVQVQFSLQREAIKALYAKWKWSTAWIEMNSIGRPNLEALIDDRIPVYGFETTAKTKPPMIMGLVKSLETSDLAVPVEYMGELMAYEQRVNANTGHAAYGAPSGQHDDRVISLALADRARIVAGGWGGAV